jgi:hypothetical protein
LLPAFWQRGSFNKAIRLSVDKTLLPSPGRRLCKVDTRTSRFAAAAHKQGGLAYANLFYRVWWFKVGWTARGGSQAALKQSESFEFAQRK